VEQSTLSKPEEETTTQRYEQARAAAHRAMTSVTLVPDKPLAEPEQLSYRGFKFGAAFFGWLIMVSMLILLSAVVAGAAVAAYYILGYTKTDLEDSAGTVAISAAAAVVLVIMLAFYIGGYVAGRLARFDGMRQGFGVWMISLLLIVLACSVGAFLNSNYDYTGRIDRPEVPLTDDSLLTGGLITAAALLMLPLLFALLGGRTGQRYHDKIDDLLP
jgi:cytochrome bd-type quinol oxidase subunit 2